MFNSSNTKRIKIEAANATLVEGHHEDHNGENLVKKSGSNFYKSKSLQVENLVKSLRYYSSVPNRRLGRNKRADGKILRKH